MSLQTDKRNLDLQITRYMTLLSNLANPPADYINDLDYMRGLVQIADQQEMASLEQTWFAIKPTDARSVRYIETGELGNGRVVQNAVNRGLFDLAENIQYVKGMPHD